MTVTSGFRHATPPVAIPMAIPKRGRGAPGRGSCCWSAGSSWCENYAARRKKGKGGSSPPEATWTWMGLEGAPPPPAGGAARKEAPATLSAFASDAFASRDPPRKVLGESACFNRGEELSPAEVARSRPRPADESSRRRDVLPLFVVPGKTVVDEDEDEDEGDWGWFGNQEEEPLALPYMPPIEGAPRKLSFDSRFASVPSEDLLLE